MSLIGRHIDCYKLLIEPAVSWMPRVTEHAHTCHVAVVWKLFFWDHRCGFPSAHYKFLQPITSRSGTLGDEDLVLLSKHVHIIFQFHFIMQNPRLDLLVEPTRKDTCLLFLGFLHTISGSASTCTSSSSCQLGPSQHFRQGPSESAARGSSPAMLVLHKHHQHIKIDNRAMPSHSFGPWYALYQVDLHVAIVR